MRSFGRIFALSLAVLCASAVPAAAAPTATTLTCYNHGAPALTINVNSLFFDFGFNAPGQQYFAVFTDISEFDNLIFQQLQVNQFDVCQLSADSRTYPAAVSVESISASVGLGGTYTQIIFSYLTLFGSPTPANSAARAALTSADKAKSLAAFLAKVRPPTATQK